MKRLRKERVPSLLEERLTRGKVYCPQWVTGRDLMLVPLGEGFYDGVLGKTTIGSKMVLFPQTEPMISFRGETIAMITESQEVLLFGIRPCDMKSIRFIDWFMSRDNIVDPQYASRRKGITTVVVACNEPPSATCFCVDTGGAPFLENGFDLQLFDAGDRYIAFAGSQRGEALLTNGHFEPPEETDQETVEVIKQQAAVSQERKPGVKKALEVLRESRPDSAFWDGLAARCLCCGGCAYVCPTCTCFNVRDHLSEEGHLRCRTWDACLHAGFTREASGHNPRPTQGSRLARRYEHKLKFDTVNFGEPGCVGCGRCSDACPVGLGALEIIELLNGW